MRRVLVDHARAHQAVVRGGGAGCRPQRRQRARDHRACEQRRRCRRIEESGKCKIRSRYPPLHLRSTEWHLRWRISTGMAGLTSPSPSEPSTLPADMSPYYAGMAMARSVLFLKKSSSSLANTPSGWQAKTPDCGTGSVSLKAAEIDGDGISDLVISFRGCHTPYVGVAVLYMIQGLCRRKLPGS